VLVSPLHHMICDRQHYMFTLGQWWTLSQILIIHSGLTVYELFINIYLFSILWTIKVFSVKSLSVKALLHSYSAIIPKLSEIIGWDGAVSSLSALKSATALGRMTYFCLDFIFGAWILCSVVSNLFSLLNISVSMFRTSDAPSICNSS
jgi:hypothetical protein